MACLGRRACVNQTSTLHEMTRNITRRMMRYQSVHIGVLSHFLSIEVLTFGLNVLKREQFKFTYIWVTELCRWSRGRKPQFNLGWSTQVNSDWTAARWPLSFKIHTRRGVCILMLRGQLGCSTESANKRSDWIQHAHHFHTQARSAQSWRQLRKISIIVLNLIPLGRTMQCNKNIRRYNKYNKSSHKKQPDSKLGRR